MITSMELFANWMRARFGTDDRGASLVEYALVVALIAVVCIGAISILGNQAKESFSTTGDAISSANGATP